MEWKTELERLKEKLELLDCTCMEHKQAEEIREALKGSEW